MAKNYVLNVKPDSSFASCLCSLLIFLAITIILLLVAWNLGRHPKEIQVNVREETISTHTPVTTENCTTESIQSTTEESTKSPSTTVYIAPIPKTIKHEEHEQICNSTKCETAAGHILGSINYAAAPCDDFYEYACGGGATYPDEEDDGIDLLTVVKGPPPKFINHFRTFYMSCVRYEDRFKYRDRIKKAKELIHSVGYFQYDGQANTTYNVTEFLANLILMNTMPLFDIGIDIDKETSNYILKFMLPDETAINLEHWSTLAENKRKCLRELEQRMSKSRINLTSSYDLFLFCQKNYSDYLNSIEYSMEEVQIFSNLSDAAYLKHIKDIRFSIEFEILYQFDKLPVPPNVQEEMVKENFKVRQVSDLQTLFPGFQWKDFFRVLTGHELDDNTKVRVYYQEYFKEMLLDLSRIEKPKMNNAFLSLLVNSLFENTVLPSHRHNRKEFCLDLSRDLMPDIVNYLYKLAYKTDDLEIQRNKIDSMFEILRKTFANSIENSTWLDAVAKTQILTKLNKLKVMTLNNEDVTAEKAHLKTVYEDLDIRFDEFQENLLALIKKKNRIYLGLQGQKATPETIFRYFVKQAVKDPVSSYTSDLIGIPTALSRLTQIGIPDYITMARVGFYLAKEIVRHFDPVGIKYDVTLEDAAKATYMYMNETTNNMLSLTSPRRFGKKNINFKVNNGLSKNERFIENAAFKLTMDSFLENNNEDSLPWISQQFSKKNIFILSLTQEFCKKITLMDFMVQAFESPLLPSQLRIDNLMMNSEDFAKIYDCPVGSRMTLAKDKLEFPYFKKGKTSN